MNQPRRNQQNKPDLVRYIHAVLNENYQDKIEFIAGIASSKNHGVAEMIAEIITKQRAVDRKYIESQILALLLAFQAGE